jgi:UDP-2,4-diacetamido-2,4,6-trideoxy-beta-L-altropyranose hydrolase
MPPGSLIVRADANTEIGTGHVMRCLALAQSWQDAGGHVVFAVAESPAALKNRLASEGFRIADVLNVPGSQEDAGVTVDLAREHGAQWVLVDGERFDSSFLSGIQSAGLRAALIDDFARRDLFPADLIVNPNLGATAAPYRQTGASAKLLLGESYTLLRREFTSWKGSRRAPSAVCRVLVTLGGSDPENLAPQVVRVLAGMPSLSVTVVAGAGYTGLGELKGATTANVHLVCNATNMPELMANAEIAIIAAGGTLWELLYMRCVVLSYARNPVQARVVTELALRSAVCNLGDTQSFDGSALAGRVEEFAESTALRERMSEAGHRIVDGKGTSRVLQALWEHGGNS